MSGSESDSEGPLGSVGLLVEQIVQEAARGDARLNVIDLDDDTIEDGWTLDEQAYDADILKIESESIDLTQDDDDDDDDDEASRSHPAGVESDTNLRCQHYVKGARNPCLCGHHDRESNYYLGGVKVRNDNVHGLKIELRISRFIVDFIEIKEIWVHRNTGAVLVRGFAYTRTRNLDGRIQAYKSEVCRLLEIDTDDDRPVNEQSLIEVTLEDLHPKNRVLHITNKDFPGCRFDPDVYNTIEDREELAPLTARWVHIMEYPDKRYRRAQRPIDGETIAHIRERDVLKSRHRDSDAERLQRWRGDSVKGGSYVSQEVDDKVPTPDGKKTLRYPKHKYCAADMFSGAGGYTAGAKRAGIKVVYALDHWARCNATYRTNHPEVELKEQDIMVYCNDLTLPDVRFDFVHLSPPCQTWSPAHTCAGKNDSANIAALYACTDIIFRFRPRIVTFEQTFGIIQERHLPWFNALVQSLTKHGYSLTWKVIRLVEYGLPQTRKRLIMIGAAPGEELPPFPTPTHAAEPCYDDDQRYRKRFVSAIKACSGLVDGMNLHDPSGVKQLQRQPWDGNQPMNRTITTSGGQAYHWDGERDLTLAEFARLQGFSDNYVFKAPCIKKQIGNAFPPTVVHAIMKQLVHWLERVDNINSSPREEDVVHIDDGGDADDEFDHRCRPNGARSPKYEREPEPDYHDYQGYFEDINFGLSEQEAFMAALEESRKMVDSRGEVIDLAGDGPLSTCNPSTTNNTASSFQNMTSTDRSAWASKIAQSGGDTSQGNSQTSRRRQSSGSSSVVITGQRQLPTIIEDDDEVHAGEGSSNAGVDHGCVDAQQQSSSSVTYVAEEASSGGQSSADASALAPPPPSSPVSGNSRSPVHTAFGSIPSSSDWSLLRALARSSATGRGAPSSSLSSARALVFDASQWQEERDEDDALARAMETSIKDAVQRHEEQEQKEELGGIGLSITGVGVSGSGSGFSNRSGPLAPTQAHGNDEEQGEAYEGKGKGKAVAKRSLDGADDYAARNGSPPKKGRVDE